MSHEPVSKVRLLQTEQPKTGMTDTYQIYGPMCGNRYAAAQEQGLKRGYISTYPGPALSNGQRLALLCNL
ncbi:hypothetical protein GGTG_04407 [Gaeumannomyces tritici R3-111a-1]|uniref:Uncharacterized protein n=1 Tax=Gaeumannomyces tritici (strain R3-111a-1) TaxID=644352 RepID=J3NT09_GAET3|nr:hypothetical protein GGTG_04407 [Gaeumannomyces tritici R3-111a-1]EJT79322.1 hypothetical protein GGTG_04407 [Gaeumannomyces tritici R3-111a-1]